MQNPGVDVYAKSLYGPRVDSIAGTQLVNNSFWGISDVKLPVLPQTTLQNDGDEEEGTY